MCSFNVFVYLEIAVSFWEVYLWNPLIRISDLEWERKPCLRGMGSMELSVIYSGGPPYTKWHHGISLG